MNLVIHDLNENEWEKIADGYNGWEVISDQGTIKPCVGCFGCWVKTPGQCVIRDGYNHMGALIHQADEVMVISRYTYGGFSSFVKNVFDRSIGWVLPYFEVYEGEMHHKKRYPEDKRFSFIFRGSSFTDEEMNKARAYVEAVCRNFRGKAVDIQFVENRSLSDEMQKTDAAYDADKVILFNGSLRGDQANTRKFLNMLACHLDGKPEIINLSSYMKRMDELVRLLLSAETVVLGMPLYVDGIPSQMLRVMEKMEKAGHASGKKIYCVANMGLYESHQIKNLISMVRDWSNRCGYDYCGSLAIGAGEMMGMFMNPKSNGKGPAKNVFSGLDQMAKAVNSQSQVKDIYADASLFPRWLYMFAANSGWPKAGKNNGLKKKDLLRRCETENASCQ